MKILLGYALTFGWVFLMLALAGCAKKLFRAGEETSRKIVHVSVAFAWLPMYFCFGQSWHLLVPPAAFVVLNYISCRSSLFSMMERSQTEKKSYGTVFYALSMLIMAAFSLWDNRCMLPYGTALFCMALGDGFAPCFGSIKRGNRYFFNSRRSLYGCVSVFLVCGLVISIMNSAFSMQLEWWNILILAWSATAFELVGVKGTDNLTLPLGVFAVTCLFVL